MVTAHRDGSLTGCACGSVEDLAGELVDVVRHDERVLHVRMTLPADLTEPVLAALDDPRVTGMVVLPGAARQPHGDAVSCDVAREGATELLARLDEVGVTEHGTLSLETVDSAPSRRARSAEHEAVGAPDDGVVWPLVEEQAAEGVRSSWSFFVFLSLATLLAAIAVVLDSSILVVGAMVLGPEFAPVMALAVAVVLRQPVLARQALMLLLTGLAVAVAVTLVLSLVARGAGWVTLEALEAPRPQTGFIWHPDRWSFVVALLAGIAGVLSLTSGRSNVLVGVFISVTTVPAAGNLGLGLAFLDSSEISGSAAQLGLNLAGMVVAGVLTLVQRWSGRVIGRRRSSRARPTARAGS